MLTPEILESPERLAVLLQEVGSNYSGRRNVTDLQRQLRSLVSDEAWTVFLRLEEALNERSADLQEALARWAFEEGRR